MGIQDLIKEREEIDKRIKEEIAQLPRYKDMCVCSARINTVEVLSYPDEEEGHGVQIISYCTDCGGYLLFS